MDTCKILVTLHTVVFVCFSEFWNSENRFLKETIEKVMQTPQNQRVFREGNWKINTKNENDDIFIIKVSVIGSLFSIIE